MTPAPVCSFCLCALRRRARFDAVQLKTSSTFQRRASQATRRNSPESRGHSSAKVAAPATKPPAGRSPTSEAAASTARGSTAKDAHAQKTISGSSGALSTASMVQTLRSRAPRMSETYTAYGVCELLAKECGRVAEYTIPQAANSNEEIPKNEKNEDIGIAKGWWYEELGLPPTFNSWARVTLLHLWCLTVRLRAFPAASAGTWNQHLTNQFFYLAEDKMVLLHRLHSRAARAALLKQLFEQWRGLVVAYDVGLVQGDAQLAGAVWRNLCGGDMNVDFVKLAQVVAYMRSVLRNLGTMEDAVIARGDIVFGDPSEEEKLVNERSRLWDVPFDDDDLQSGALPSGKAP